MESYAQLTSNANGCVFRHANCYKHLLPMNPFLKKQLQDMLDKSKREKYLGPKKRDSMLRRGKKNVQDGCEGNSKMTSVPQKYKIQV